jgi:hypothetical protein
MPGRCIATKIVDESLGFNLVPRTEMARVDGQLGIAMDMVPGEPFITKERRESPESVEALNSLLIDKESPEYEDKLIERQTRLDYRMEEGWKFEFHPEDSHLPQWEQRVVRATQEVPILTQTDFDNPELQRDLVKLQLLDGLTGQVDRHGGNYVMQRDHEGAYVGLKAIDNDQSFGKKLLHPDSISSAPRTGPRVPGGDVFHGVSLPGVVDTDMKKAIDDLKPDALRARLTGVLPKEDVEAAVSRLKVMKKHVAQLEKNGMVIRPDQWGTEKAREGLGGRGDSYWAREKDNLESMDPGQVRDFPLPPPPMVDVPLD